MWRTNIEKDRLNEFNTMCVGFIVKNRSTLAESLQEFMDVDFVERKMGDNLDQCKIAIAALKTMSDYDLASLVNAFLSDGRSRSMIVHDQEDFEVFRGMLKLCLKLAGQYNLDDLQNIEYDKNMNIDQAEKLLMETVPELFFED